MSSNYNTQLRTLREAQDSLSAGYAYDLIEAFIAAGTSPDGAEADGTADGTTASDAGDLFRTLVLDEGFAVDEARGVYNAAYDIAQA